MVIMVVVDCVYKHAIWTFRCLFMDVYNCLFTHYTQYVKCNTNNENNQYVESWSDYILNIGKKTRLVYPIYLQQTYVNTSILIFVKRNIINAFRVWE